MGNDDRIEQLEKHAAWLAERASEMRATGDHNLAGQIMLEHDGAMAEARRLKFREGKA